MRSLAAVLFTFCVLGARTVAAFATVAYPQSYTAAVTSHPLGDDVALADPAWESGRITRDSDRFENITTRSAAQFGTDAWLLYDAKNLYVGFRIEQPTAPIVAKQSTNYLGFGLDDFVGVGLDPTGTGSAVYFFETTPRAIRYQQASENTRYQPVWNATAQMGPSGWTAVLTIPLRALHH